MKHYQVYDTVFGSLDWADRLRRFSWYVMFFLLGGSLILTAYDSLNFGCAIVLCRAHIDTGHLATWISVALFGIVASFHFRDSLIGLASMGLAIALGELMWNTFNVFVHLSVLPPALAFAWWFTSSQLAMLSVVLFYFYISDFKCFVDKKRLVLLVVAQCIVTAVWVAGGFPLSVFGGQTNLYNDPSTNLVEVYWYVIWLLLFSWSLSKHQIHASPGARVSATDSTGC